LKPSLRLLFAVCVIDVLGFGILIPLVPYMADRFGAPPEVITPILGVYSLCQLVAAPFWGRMSDRYGRRPILMASLAGACVSYVMLGLATNLWWLLASRALGGFMAGNIAAAFAYAADISEPRERAASLGMVGAAIGVGFMLGPAIGGLLSGEDLHTANFVRPAAVSAGLSLLAIALVYFVLPESHPVVGNGRPRPVESARRSGALRLLAERPALRFLAGASLLVTFSQAILESIFAIWAMDHFGFGPRTVGLVMFGLAFIAVSVQGGFIRLLVPRFGEPRVATAGILAFVAGLLTVALVTTSGTADVTPALVGLVLCGLGAGAFNPSASALASRQSDELSRGAVMGTYQASGSLARVIGPFVSGPIYALLGPAAPFVVGACVTLPAAWCIWRSLPVSPSPAKAR